jgi:HSP20 family protein
MILHRVANTMDPWQEMSRLQQRMNRLFDDFNVSAPQQPFPAINLWTDNETAFISVELPGLENKDISLSVLDRNVVLEGKREPEPLKEGESYHRQERGYGNFKRSIQLPFPVNANKVNAKFQHGILTISLPRAEEDKPKKIAIRS